MYLFDLSFLTSLPFFRFLFFGAGFAGVILLIRKLMLGK